MGKVRVLVHLGPMKTGTSAFAAHLSRGVEDGSIPENILYPSGDLWFPARGSIVKHHDLVELAPATPPVAAMRHRATEATPELIRERLQRIVAEATKRKGDVTVVMVCEIADQRATPALGDVLREYFDRVDFVIVAREQAGAVRSLMGQQIRMWKRTEVVSTNPRDYVARQASRGGYDYAKLWDKWSVSSTSYTMHFVPYRSGGVGRDDLNQDIFDAVGLGDFPHAESVLSGQRIHSNFTAAGMRRLAATKRWSYRLRAIPGALRVGERIFERTLSALHREVEAGRVTRETEWTFAPEDQQSVREAYRASNERFRTQLGAVASSPNWSRWFDRVLEVTGS